MSSTHTRTHSAEIEMAQSGKRLDQVLAQLWPDYSRRQLQNWIRAGQVTVNGETRRPRDKIRCHDRVVLQAVITTHSDCQPQPIPLDIRFEDEHILVLDKPAGLVVHPAAGCPDGTLQNGLLHYAPGLSILPRAGIVHRLDKDTTGLMVVAKTARAYQVLVAALAAHEVQREYAALVTGVVTAGGRIDQPIGRHPTRRTCMAVHPLGKAAVTHYRVHTRFPRYTLLRVQLETGRTHQIRVHMAAIRHPLVGDPVYGGRLQLPAGADSELVQQLRQFKRQALHAQRLSLAHPETGQQLSWEAPIPEDMRCLLDVLAASSCTQYT
ncbi:MAG: 23S rRNA pseudouridine(1911/1915/1917) synthase RluD [Pseudomonadota bacterium]